MNSRIEGLRETIRYHAYQYYVLDKPEITDGDYDTLFRALQQLEKANPEYPTVDSPTQLVGTAICLGRKYNP